MLAEPSLLAEPQLHQPDKQALIEDAIAQLRTHLKRDGGDIELISIDGDRIVVDLKGNCTGCVLSSVTLAGIRARLVEAVGRPLRVIPLSALKGMAVQ
jgi:NifU-like protein